MELTKSNILVGIVLLGSIAHVMILMNGYWNGVFWVTAIAVIAIPMAIHKSTGPQHRRRRRLAHMEI